MAQSYLGQKRLRKYYGKIREVLDMPNLIEVQKSSYDLFLRSGEAEIPTDGEGIKGVFQSVFPIKDFNETSVLEFVGYDLERPKYDVEECQQRDMTYSAPLKVTLRLIVFDVDEDTGATTSFSFWRKKNRKNEDLEVKNYTQQLGIRSTTILENNEGTT